MFKLNSEIRWYHTQKNVKQWSTFTGPIQALRLGNNIIKWTTSEKCSKVLRIQVKFTPTHAIPSSGAIRRPLHKSDTASVCYIRSDSVGIVQQDAHKQPGGTSCKGWTNCTWVVMGHWRWRCLNANWMGQFGNNVQSAINEVCLQMYKRLHRHGI